MTGKDIKVALIGLDTSHTIEFAKRMQSPDCPKSERVDGMRAVSCLRFSTPFQSEEGLNARQQQLTAWGIPVMTSFDEAVADCDAVMLEINDPSLHLEYVKRCADLGKPIFLDKPLADNLENGREIGRIASERNLRMFTSSSLRFVPEVRTACAAMPNPSYSYAYGILGKAAAGSSIIWYGIHSFEMLQMMMGNGAAKVTTTPDSSGVVVVVEYVDGRRGVVELTVGAGIFGGMLKTGEHAVPFAIVDDGRDYTELVRAVAKFFSGGEAPVGLEASLEIIAMLDAAERSLQEKKSISL